MSTNQFLEISYKSIFKVASVIGLIWLLFRASEVLIILFISVILTSSFKPIIKQFDKYKVPKGIATLIVVAGSVGLFGLVLYAGIRPLIAELSAFISHFGDFVDSLSRNYNIQIPNEGELVNLFRDYFGALGGQVGNASSQLFRIGSSVFSVMLSTLALVALTFYQLAEEHKTRNFIASFFGKNDAKVRRIIDHSEKKLGAWFRGQISLMFFIGLITYCLLFVLGLSNETIARFALPLAIIAGLLEIVPVLGPTIALIPALVVGLTISPLYAIIILVMYVGIQQVEANVIIPRVMNKAVGLDPILVILGIMIGNTLIGALGSLLSVPVMAVISVLYEEARDEVK
jgi:predicted PurR-regulated permease PerM